MPSTTTYRRGDIILVSFPFTDLTSTKRRLSRFLSLYTFGMIEFRDRIGTVRKHGERNRSLSCIGKKVTP